MAANRTPSQRAFDRAFVARLCLEGLTQVQIAAMLSEETGRPVTQQTVSRDLVAVREEWRTAALASTEQRVGEELARLDLLERTYWEAYKRSCGVAVVSTTTTIEPADSALPATTGGGAAPAGEARGRRDGGGDRRRAPRATTRQTVQTRQQMGNPAWLAGLQRCHERRCKLLGLDAPDRVLLGVGTVGSAIPARLGPTPEELEETRAIMLDYLRNPGGGETPPGTPRRRLGVGD